jgi:hypothetical protein
MAVLALTSLAGCSTTQQEAARLQLNSARLRAAEVALQITRRDPEIEVERVAVVRGAGGSAIVVRLRNLSAQPVSDLPIAVGVVSSRHRRRRGVLLNTAGGGDYFANHTPSIPAGGELTWVLATGPLPAGVRAFAEVGVPAAAAPLVIPRALPRVVVSAVAAMGAVKVTVSNHSSVPQYQLPVYAVVWSHGHLRAAGQATIAHLGTGSTTTLRLSLTGRFTGGALAVQAPPTIFG